MQLHVQAIVWKGKEIRTSKMAVHHSILVHLWIFPAFSLCCVCIAAYFLINRIRSLLKMALSSVSNQMKLKTEELNQFTLTCYTNIAVHRNGIPHAIGVMSKFSWDQSQAPVCMFVTRQHIRLQNYIHCSTSTFDKFDCDDTDFSIWTIVSFRSDLAPSRFPVQKLIAPQLCLQWARMFL